MYSETRHGAKHPIAPLSRLYTSHSDSILVSRLIFDRVRSRLSLVGRHSARKWWRAPSAAYRMLTIECGGGPAHGPLALCVLLKVLQARRSSDGEGYLDTQIKI